MKNENLEVVHQKEENRFVMDIDGKIAKVDYRHRDGKLWLVHSEVPLNLRGQGYGKILIEKTLEKLTEEGYKAVAVCPFIRKVVSRSPRWKKIIEYE